jgi:hypothetical protein
MLTARIPRPMQPRSKSLILWKMMRRPDQLAGMRNSLGRRQIEPESFVSSSCVGDQFQNLERHRTER